MRHMICSWLKKATFRGSGEEVPSQPVNENSSDWQMFKKTEGKTSPLRNAILLQLLTSSINLRLSLTEAQFEKEQTTPIRRYIPTPEINISSQLIFNLLF